MPPSNTAAAWKGLTDDQRRQAMARMSPDQKKQLAVALGYKEQTAEQSKEPTGFFGGVGSELLNAGKGIAGMFAPPSSPEEATAYGLNGPVGLAAFRMGRGEVESRGEAFRQAGQQFRTAGTIKGEPGLKGLQYARSGVTALTGALPVPGIASMSTNLNRVADTGNIPELWGRGLTDIGMLAAGGRKGTELERRAGEVDPVSPLERKVRSKIVPRLNPVNTDAYAKMVEIAREPTTLPDLAEYAQRTNNPMRDLLQMGRASTAAGREITGYYRENFIDPNSDIATGPDSTVGKDYARASEINDLLSPTYLKQGSKLSATIDSERAMSLQRELNEVNNRLYQTLSERSGMPVEQIQAINQRGARLQNLGKQLEVAQTTLEQGGAGMDAMGNLLPHSPYHPLFQLLTRGINALRGGRMAIQARKVGRAVRNFPEGYQELPDPEEIASYRRGVERSELGRVGSEAERARENVQRAAERKPAGLGPTNREEFLQPEKLDPRQAVEEFVKKQTERKEAALTRSERLANALRQQRLREQQRLARAREIQGQAKVSKEYRGNQ